MGDRRVIAFRCLPMRLPVGPTIVLWLLLDRLQVRGTWLGLIWGLWGVVALIAVVAVFTQKQVDLFASSRPRD